MALHFQVAYSGITVGDEICDLLAKTYEIPKLGGDEHTFATSGQKIRGF